MDFGARMKAHASTFWNEDCAAFLFGPSDSCLSVSHHSVGVAFLRSLTTRPDEETEGTLHASELAEQISSIGPGPRDIRGKLVLPLFRMSGESETEEWCFDVRHARLLSSFLRVPSPAAHPMQHPMQRRPGGTKPSRHVWLRHSQPGGPSGRSPSGTKSRPKGPGPSGVEAWAVAVSLGTQETPAMLEAAAGTSVRSLVFMSGRLVQMHLQAERRKRRESTAWPTAKEERQALTQEDDSNCMVSFM